MKEILYFIKWQLNRWTFVDVIWTVSCGLLGYGFTESYLHPEDPVPWQTIAGFAGWFMIMFKMAVVDSTRNNWQRYQREKSKLLNEIQGQS